MSTFSFTPFLTGTPQTREPNVPTPLLTECTKQKILNCFSKFDTAYKYQIFVDSDNVIWIKCKDVLATLGVSWGAAHCKHTLSKLSYIQYLAPTFDICNATLLPLPQNQQPTEMVAAPNLETFALFAIGRQRKPLTSKITTLQKIGVHTSAKIHVPIEVDLLSHFVCACPFDVELQYRIGKYRVDAYIPRMKIAIEIDENGHRSYDVRDEKIYEETLRDHRILLVRHTPDVQNPVASALDLIQTIWKKTLSPDYQAFQQQYRLAL